MDLKTKEIEFFDRERIWNILRKQRPKLIQEKSDRFFNDLSDALSEYRRSSIDKTTYRDTSEALRDLFKMIERPKTPIDKIRKKFKLLPEIAREEVLRRAIWRFPELLGQSLSQWNDLCAWIDQIEDHKVIETVPLLIATGRTWSEGQIRMNGKKSAPHIEPLILGRFRRFHPLDTINEGADVANAHKMPKQPSPKGGRPKNFAIDNFLSNFCLIWFEATGHTPKRIKGHKTPFIEAAEIALELAGILKSEPHLKRLMSSLENARSRESNVPWDR